MNNPPFAPQNQDVVRQIQTPLRMPGGAQRTPDIDPQQMSLVYPLSPEWLAVDMFFMQSGSQSINGAGFNWTLDGTAAGTVAPGPEPGPTTTRRYETLGVILAGGTVTPQTVNLIILNVAGGMLYRQYVLTNPGSYFWDVQLLLQDPLYLRFAVGTGGAGDTVTCYASGISSPLGVGVPAI